MEKAGGLGPESQMSDAAGPFAGKRRQLLWDVPACADGVSPDLIPPGGRSVLFLSTASVFTHGPQPFRPSLGSSQVRLTAASLPPVPRSCPTCPDVPPDPVCASSWAHCHSPGPRHLPRAVRTRSPHLFHYCPCACVQRTPGVCWAHGGPGGCLVRPSLQLREHGGLQRRHWPPPSCVHSPEGQIPHGPHGDRTP